MIPTGKASGRLDIQGKSGTVYLIKLERVPSVAVCCNLFIGV